MSETEKEILKSIDESISKMSDFDKGYLLGMAESKAAEKRGKDEKKNDKNRTIK